MTELPAILVKYKGQTLDAATIIAIVNEACAVPDRRVPIAHIAPMELRGFVFAVERYADCLEEMKPLHAAHWQETEKYRHGLALNPDYDGFMRMEMAGSLLLFTIRRDGELVGQTTMKTYTSMHSQTKVANEDSLFLREDCRGSVVAIIGFLRYVMAGLASTGVLEVRVSSKLVNSADKLMRRVGFKPFATQLVAMLDPDRPGYVIEDTTTEEECEA